MEAGPRRIDEDRLFGPSSHQAPRQSVPTAIGEPPSCYPAFVGRVCARTLALAFAQATLGRMASRSLFARAQVTVNIPHDVVFLHPVPADSTLAAPTQDDPELRGCAVVSLPRAQKLKEVKVVMKGLCTVQGASRERVSFSSSVCCWRARADLLCMCHRQAGTSGLT